MWSRYGRSARTSGRSHAKPTAFLREHRLEGRFIVMFSGNLELGGDMDTLIGALAELRAEPGDPLCPDQ